MISRIGLCDACRTRLRRTSPMRPTADGRGRVSSRYTNERQILRAANFVHCTIKFLTSPPKAIQ